MLDKAKEKEYKEGIARNLRNLGIINAVYTGQTILHWNQGRLIDADLMQKSLLVRNK